MHSGSQEVAALERRYLRKVIGPTSYREALETFAGLWALACQLNPDFPGSWEEDVAADIELARVLNGLPERL